MQQLVSFAVRPEGFFKQKEIGAGTAFPHQDSSLQPDRKRFFFLSRQDPVADRHRFSETPEMKIAS